MGWSAIEEEQEEEDRLDVLLWWERNNSYWICLWGTILKTGKMMWWQYLGGLRECGWNSPSTWTFRIKGVLLPGGSLIRKGKCVKFIWRVLDTLLLHTTWYNSNQPLALQNIPLNARFYFYKPNSILKLVCAPVQCTFRLWCTVPIPNVWERAVCVWFFPSTERATAAVVQTCPVSGDYYLTFPKHDFSG
jgi:hypothetical protein